MSQQKKPFKRRNWFENKQCNICKKPGTTFRYFDHKHQYIICENAHCELMTRIKAGYFGNGVKIKGV